MKKTIAALFFLLSVAVRADTALAVIDFETTPSGGMPTDDGPILGAYTDSGVQISFGFDGDSNGSAKAPAIFERARTFQGEGMNIGFVGSDDGITTVAETADTGFGGQLGGWFYNFYPTTSAVPEPGTLLSVSLCWARLR